MDRRGSNAEDRCRCRADARDADRSPRAHKAREREESNVRRVLLATALAAVSIAVPTATSSVAAAPTTTSSNPWNVSVVRFAPGTTRAQMYTTVKNSGGVVTTDLSQINALAVVSTNKAFRTDVKANARVRAVWLDKVVRSAPPEAGAGAMVGNNTPQLGHPGTDPVPDPSTTRRRSWGRRTPRASCSGTTTG